MIDELVVENFKGFGDRQTIPLAPITLIFGGNSAGKTSLIQALLLMRQSLTRLDRLPVPRSTELVVRGELVDLGSFDSLIYRHERKRELTIGWSTHLGQSPVAGRYNDYVPDPSGRVTTTLSFRRPARAAQIGHTGSTIGDHVACVAFKPYSAPRSAGESSRLSRQMPGEDLVIATADDTRRLFDLAATQVSTSRASKPSKLLPNAGRTIDSKGILRVLRDSKAMAIVGTSSGIPARVLSFETESGPFPLDRPEGQGSPSQAASLLQEAATVIDGWMAVASRAARSVLGGVTYLGPMRQAPERLNVLTGEAVRGAGNRGEHVVDLLARRKQLLPEVNTWFERLAIPYSLEIRAVTDKAVAGAIGEVHCLLLTDRRTGVEVSPMDVGFGIGQVLPVVVQTVLNRRGTLCIEQPEIHLHPRLQAELAELFAERVGRQDQQFILETHSEHLILRLQRLVRRGALEASQLGVLYVGEGPEGQSEVRHLRLDKHGDFVDEWPGGFFDERFDELFEDR